MGRPLARVSVCVAAGAALVIGCQLVAGLDDPLPAPASDASTALDVTLPDSAGVDGASDAFTGADTSRGDDASSLDTGVDTGCPATTQGPELVNVGPFCIDSTEVTNSQYNVFVSANAPLTLQPPGVCDFNATYVPFANWPYVAGNDDYPVADVNWCQAYAFCAWAGKHLCGAIDGGPADPGNFAAFDNAHYYACSMNGAQNWPYGTTYEQYDCNDVYYDDGGGTVPVASIGNCEGSYPNVFDLVGNVEEWQDACQGDGGPNDRCFDGTGSFSFPGPDSGIFPGCNFEDGDLRSTYDDELGFRCCSP